MRLYTSIDGDETLTVLTGETHSILDVSQNHAIIPIFVFIAIFGIITAYLFLNEDTALHIIGAGMALLFGTGMIVTGAYFLNGGTYRTEFSYADIQQYTTKYELASMGEGDINQEIKDVCLDAKNTGEEQTIYITRNNLPIELHISYEESNDSTSDKCFLKQQEVES